MCRFHFEGGPLILKLFHGPCIPTLINQLDPGNVIFVLKIQVCDSMCGQNNADNGVKTYFLMRALALVSRQQILPPLFAIHFSLHWSHVQVPSKCSDTIFQNLGVLSDDLPCSSIVCMT
jgi:hypothetical protein